MSDSFLIDNGFIPDNDTNYKFKRQRNAGVTSCNFLFCVFHANILKKVAEFTTLSGIESSLDSEKLIDNRLRMGHNVPGKENFNAINLGRGFGRGNFIRQWYVKSANAYAYLADSAIIILDSSRTNIFRFIVLKEAWVANYKLSDLDTKNDEEMIESISLNHKGFAFCDFDEPMTIGDLYTDEEVSYNKNVYFYADTDDVLGYGRPYTKKSLTVSDFLANIF